MVYDFEIKGRKVRLWQRLGESYEHVLLKALGFAMFVEDYPGLEIEKRVGLRYKPDLVARNAAGEFIFWGECGDNSFRKTMWLLKHGQVERLVLFKLAVNDGQFVKQLRAEISPRYRPDERLSLINFTSNIVSLTADKKIDQVVPEWFKRTII